MRGRSLGSADSQTIVYRADIDGLRAIAVMSVVIYHLSHAALPGGYLGVDIFFVISGFLITSIVWREAKGGKLSIAQFYERRIRRIFPALLLVLLTTTLFSIFILLPADLVGYGKSLLATLGFIANIYFWRDTNYFARVAEEKPLLHMWSLGVEEQFYIFFPLLLMLLSRYWKQGASFFVGVLIFLSFLLNFFVLSIGGDSPAFFLLPTRVWELCFGALIAVFPKRFYIKTPVANALSLIGIIILCFNLFDPIPPLRFFPSATWIIVSTLCIIIAGQERGSITNQLLTMRPVVVMGLISYSLYLWHWPIIVLCKYYLVREFSWTESMMILLGSMMVSFYSWRYVELPFRHRLISANTVYCIALFGAMVLAASAVVLIEMKGLPGRLSPAAAKINQAVGTNYRCPLSNYAAFGESRACFMNLPSRDVADTDIVLLGNSHAQMYAPVLEAIFINRNLNGLLVPLNGCLPTIKANISDACINAAADNLAGVMKLPKLKVVIIGLDWHHDYLVNKVGQMLDNGENEVLIGAIDDLIEQLQKMGKEVILIGPIPQPGWDVPSIVSRQLAFGHLPDKPFFISTSEFESSQGLVIQHFSTRLGVNFIRPDLFFCSENRCEFFLGQRSLFADSNHISELVLDNFRPMFEAALP